MKTILALLAAFALISPEFAALDRLALEKYQAYEQGGLEGLLGAERLDALLAYIEEQKAVSPADLWEPADDLLAEAPYVPELPTPLLPAGSPISSEPDSGIPVSGPDSAPGSAEAPDIQASAPQILPAVPSGPEESPAPAPDPDFVPEPSPAPVETIRTYAYDKTLPWAENAAICTGTATWYPATGGVKKNITVAINPGHGCVGGGKKTIYNHPDKSPKVTDTKHGKMSPAITEGCQLLDGTYEYKANMAVGFVLKDLLLQNGYNVLMLREGEDNQLDNVARSVMANAYADIHIAIHYDSTTTDRGFFAVTPPKEKAFRTMEPVASHVAEHDALCKALVEGAKSQGVKTPSNPYLPEELTQYSYATIPSALVEVGDRKSDRSGASLEKIARGILAGIDAYLAQ